MTKKCGVEWCGLPYIDDRVPTLDKYPGRVLAGGTPGMKQDPRIPAGGQDSAITYCSPSCRDAAAAPKYPMRSGPGIKPMDGMVVVFARRVSGNPTDVEDQKSRTVTASASNILPAYWEAGCYDILSSPSVPGGAGQDPTSAPTPSCNHTALGSCERCPAPAPKRVCSRCETTEVPLTMKVCVPCEKEIIVRGKSTVTDHQEDVFYKGKAFRESLSRPLSHDERIGLAIRGGWRRGWGAGR